MRFILPLALAIFILSGCKKDESQTEIDEGIITKYLSDHQLTAQRHSSGVYYIIKKTGYGGNPDYYSTIEVTYKGYLTDGTVFDKSSPGSTFTIPLSNVIAGWQVGVPLLQKGGSGVFYIPSTLGYGSKSQGVIPANSVLIFEINLVDFN